MKQIKYSYLFIPFVLLLVSICANAQNKLTSAQNYINNLKTNNPNKFAYTKGSFNVTDNGALNYEIPIVAVAGTAGMTPKITLQYNSNSGSGIMGEGWSITGLSVITRASQNIAIDGQTGKINFDDNDRLLLDGQRLINTDSTKPYWANSSEREYRTELNTFKQIKAFYVGTEVERFEARTKDGLIYYYGAVADNDVNPVYLRESINNKIMTWVLVRIEDRNGNQIDYEYDKQSLQKNFIQPRFIYYTGFKNQPNKKFASIQFNYDKSDYADNAFLEGILKQSPNAKYINGQKIIYDEYLTSIVCKFNDRTSLTPVKNKIRTYKIHYNRGKNDNRKVFIDFIEECINDDDCLKTDFTWLTENEHSQFTSSNIVTESSSETLEENYQIFTGDFNGDGLIDNCAIKIEPDKLQFVFTTNEKGQYKTISKYSVNAKVDKRCRILTNDFDANGSTDFSFNWVEGNKWHFVTAYTELNFANNTIKEPKLRKVYEKQIDPNIKWNEVFYSYTDLDADALQDIFCYYYLGNKIIFYAAKNNSNKTYSISKAPPFPTVYGSNDTIPKNTPINLGDYNSDGINDFLFTWTDGEKWHSVTSILNKGLGVSNTSIVGSGNVDLNKDKIEYSVISTQRGTIDTLEIDSIVSVKTTSTQIFPNINFPATKSVYVIDVNHDGNSDLLISYMDKIGWKVWVAIGKGNGTFEKPILSDIDSDNYPYLFAQSFGDFNGDGVIDICNTHSNEQGWFAKIAYGKSDGTFSNKNQGKIKLNASNFSYENVQPTKGMFPCEKFLNGFGELCKKSLKEMNANEDVPDEIVGNSQKAIQYFINRNHTYQQIPTPFFNSGGKNFYDEFTFTDKPKSISDDDENFKRIKDVKIYTAGGNSSVNRYKATSDANCNLKAVDGSKENVLYPNSMLFTFIDYWKPIVADLNGDGVTDFALTYPKQPDANFNNGSSNPLNGSWKTIIAINEADKSNKVSSIHLGNDAEIKIKYANTLELSAFNKDLSLSYPFIPYNVPISVVKTTESPNGIGGANSVEYNYKNPVFNLVGRGFLGFETVVLKSTATNQTTVKKNLIDSTFLHFGLMPLQEITSLINDRTVSNEVYQNAIFSTPDYGSRIVFNYIERKNVLMTDLDGDTLSMNESIYSYDKYGNLVFSRTDYPNGQSESICNEYWETSETQKGDDFVEKWIIGRLSKATINKTLNPNPQINRTSEFEYDGTTGQLKVEKILTGTQYQINKEYTYDNRGNKIKEVANPETDPTDRVTTEFTYSQDNYDRFLVEKKDALGYTIKYATDIVYGVDTAVYDNDNNKASVGKINTDYDPFGRKKKSIFPDGNYSYEETYKCNSCGVSNAAYFKISGNSQSKIPQVVFYDVLERPIKTISFDINYNRIVNTVSYDTKGRVLKTSLSYFEETTQSSEIKYSQYTYDDLGRVIKTINPDNTENKVTYNGLKITTENAKNQKNIIHNDLLGRKIKDIDNLNNTVQYKYDLDGNLAEIINQKGQVFQTEYDLDLGKQIRSFNPNIGHHVTYVYNAWGEVSLIKSGVSGKNITELKYDKIGRTISRKETKYTYSSGVNAPENKIEDWVYWDYIGATDTESGKGKLKRVRVDGDDRKFDKTFQYDKYGRLIKKGFEFKNYDNMYYDATVKSLWDNVAKNGIEIGYTYNSFGQLDSIKYPKLKSNYYTQNFSVKYNYENGFTKTVTANGKKVWEYKEGYADGNAKSILLNEGKTNTIYNYDPTNQNTNRITTTIGGSVIQDWQYDYDSIGNVLSKVDQKNSPQFKEFYEYDELNRIVKTTVANNSTLYRYDNLGNIIYKSDIGYYKYDDLNKKLIVNKDSLNYAKNDEGLAGDMDSLEYYNDALGNRVIKEIKEKKQFKIQYNHFNKPDNIYNYITSSTTNYFYDEDNNSQMELKQAIGSKSSCKFYIDGIFEFEVTEGFTFKQKFYISVNGSTIAYNDIQNNSQKDNILYLHKDALGSITAISDANGIVKDTRGEKLIYAYDIWGQRLNVKTWKPIKTEGFTKGFTGHQYWDDLGLINMGGRLFDPVIGQFLQVDPILNLEVPSLGLTPYGYCYNNPLYYTDPTGYSFWKGVGNFFKDVGRGIVRGLILAPLTGFNPLTFVIANMPGVSDFIDRNAGTIVAIEISIAMIALGAPPVAAGFATGFGSSFSQTYLNGGSIGQSLEAGMTSGVICGVTAGITQGIGTIFTGSESTAPLFADKFANQAGKAATHAAFQGLMNEAQGGNFWDGALPALVSSASDGVIGQVGGSDVTSTVQRTAIAGALGGTASMLGGGKFANGAATAAIVHMYNFEAHRALGIYMSGIGGTYNLTDEEFSSLKDDKSGVFVNGMCTYTGDKEIISFRGLTQNHFSVGDATFCVDNQGNRIGFYDCYNANRSTHRGATGEFSTWVLSKIPGKAYIIQYNNCQPIVPRDCK